MKTSEFYRYSRQLRQEVDQALSYFHDVNQQPLVETRSNRIRSVRPQTAVFRGMIGHSMVNSKILLLQRPKVAARLRTKLATCLYLFVCFLSDTSILPPFLSAPRPIGCWGEYLRVASLSL